MFRTIPNLRINAGHAGRASHQGVSGDHSRPISWLAGKERNKSRWHVWGKWDEREAKAFTATSAAPRRLAVRGPELAQAYALTADQASEQRLISGCPRAVTMQTADLRKGDDASAIWRPDFPRDGRVAIESHVPSGLAIVHEMVRLDSP